MNKKEREDTLSLLYDSIPTLKDVKIEMEEGEIKRKIMDTIALMEIKEAVRIYFNLNQDAIRMYFNLNQATDIIIEDSPPTEHDIKHPQAKSDLIVGTVWLTTKTPNDIYILQKIRGSLAHWELHIEN